MRLYANSNLDVIWEMTRRHNIADHPADLQVLRTERLLRTDLSEQTWPITDDIDLT